MNFIFCVSFTVIVLWIIGFYIVYKEIRKKDYIDFKQSVELIDLPIITLYIGEKKINFLIDTGSAYSIIDKEFVDNNNIPVLLTEEKIGLIGATGSEDCTNNTGYIDVYYNKKKMTDVFILSKQIHNTFAEIKKTKGVELNGILGVPFFNKYKYIIDFNKYKFYRK